MPYSTVFVPVQGSVNLEVPPDLRTGASAYHTNMPPGVAQVIVTWKGLDGINLWHYQGGQASVVSKIPSSTTVKPRTSGVLTLAWSAAHSLTLSNNAGTVWNASTIEKGYVAGVQIIPLATPGGV